jgi:hypothetical protein
MEQYLDIYTADNADPFWKCAVKNCQIPFAHAVGYTPDHEWKHVYADDYLNNDSRSPSENR